MRTLRDRCEAMLEKLKTSASQVDDLVGFVAAERGRGADPALRETLPLVLYFKTEQDRDEFVDAVCAAKPNMRAKRMP